MQIDLNQQEAQVLITLLDIACKASGLQAAEACVVLSKRVQEAINAPPTQAIDKVAESEAGNA